MNEHEYGMKQKIEYIESYIKYDDGYQFLGASRLIRCNDCKYRITANCERFGIKRYTQSDSFCSWAEPKETES